MHKKPKEHRKLRILDIKRTSVTKEDDEEDKLYPTHLTDSVVEKLKTCIPFHLAGNGTLINDSTANEDADDPNCPIDLHSAPSARAPSDTLLLLNKDPSSGFLRNHDLTIEDIGAGLGNIRKTGNGYNINFSELDLSNRGLVDISLVEYFSGLSSIDVSGNYIEDIRGLGALPYLTKLNASRNDLTIFGDFHAPVALKVIDCSRNKITRVINLNQLWALTHVNLSHNELTDVQGFEECKFLQTLDLSHNNISTIENLQCPSLVALLLHNNNIQEIMNLDDCYNLRALSLAENQISSLRPLRNLARLTELWVQNNKIGDLYELQHIKCQANLASLYIAPNPFNSVGLWRRMLIFLIPQLRFLDGQLVEAEESMLAKNTFNPSYEKIAYETRIAVLLDRACQAANIMVDHNVNSSGVPPIILLVGAPFSRCNKLAGLLKEKYRSKVQLGGVHSTATTLEFPNTNKDIPVSFETFMHMKGRGEFLATSHILGRVCGFTTAQITRASERSSVLVASVPLGVAITLKKWKLKPKIVLVMPTDKVDVGLLGKTASSSILKESDLDDCESFTLDEQENSWQDLHEEDEYNSSFEIHHAKEPSLPVVQFVPGKTTYDMDERGKKRPSMLPYDGHSLLKTHETEPDPMLAKRLSVGRRKSSIRRSIEFQNIQEFKSQGKDERSASSSRIDEEKHQNSEQIKGMMPSDKEFTDFNYSPPISKDKIEKMDSTTISDPDSDLLQFLTDRENQDQTPFPIANKMNKLRRIASLFLQVGGQNLMDILLEFPSLPSESHLMNSMDWNKTLLDLQLEELDSNQAYYMIFNKLDSNDESQFKNKSKEGARGLPNVQKCCIALGKDEPYQCLFIKDSSPDKPQTTTSANTGHCSSVQESHIGLSSAPYSADNQTEPLFINVDPDKNGPQEMDSLHDNEEEKPLTTRETIPMRTICRNVFNPNYAFGPREVCCQEKRHKICQDEKKQQHCKPLPCCVNDLDRGIFYDGTFKQNFLDSQSPSDISVDTINVNNEIEIDETEEDDPNQLRQIVRVESQKQVEDVQETIIDPGSCHSDSGSNYKESPPPSSFDEKDSGKEGEYEEEEEMYGEDHKHEHHYFSTAPPPSREAKFKSDSELNKTDEENSSKDLDDGDMSDANQPVRKHRQNRIEACIMNSRENYVNFNGDNPGFFCSIIDSASMDSCLKVLTVTVNDCLRAIKISSSSKKPITYAYRNQTDSVQFLKHRLNDHKQNLTTFTKGYSHPSQLPKFQSFKKSKECSTPMYFEKTKCPGATLLEPFVARRRRNAKIRQIIQS